MAITVIVSFQAKPDQVDALVEFLGGLQPRVIASGCSSITLFRDREHAHRVFEIEQWETVEAQQAFVQQLAAAGAFDNLDALLQAPVEIFSLNAVKTTLGS